MLRSYLLRFAFRALTLLCVAAAYMTRREALDFTKNPPLLNLLWLALTASFVMQLSPRARVSRGCLKQHARWFLPTAVGGDRARTARLDRDAARVALAWIALNLPFLALYLRGIIGVPTLVLLTAFYYVCDLICVLFYCPFQTLLMKNKCCVTCRIFAWGTIMIATPLSFVPHPWSWSVTALALVCVIRWEAAFRRHPERFAEETNAFLSCNNCTDRMCAIKKRGLFHRQPR